MTTASSSLLRRLWPLYAAVFLQSCVFWYSIEKLFMTGIGFTATTIGLMAAAYSVVMLIVETPSGLLADRWSRQGMLVIASVLLAAASLICGLSGNVGWYIVGAMFWGGFYALYSGTYDPIVYDTLLEDTGHTDGFKRYFGGIKAMDGLGLVVGSLVGAWIAASLSLRDAYLWTVPVALLAAVMLLVFREPKLHKAEAPAPMLAHVRQTFRAVLSHTSLFGLLLVLVLGTVLVEILFEFNQLWLIAAGTPVALYGIAGAILLSTVGIAGLLANKLQLGNHTFVVLFTSLLLISGLALTLVRTPWAVIIAQTTVAICLLALGIIYTEKLHDQLPSAVRAGASSAVSTIGRVLFIIIAIAFGWFTEHFSVFQAAWIIVVPLTFICLYIVRESWYKTGAGRSL